MRTLKLLALAPFALVVACGGGDQNTQPSVPSTPDMSSMEAGAPSSDMTTPPADTTAPATPPADTTPPPAPAADTSAMDAGAPAPAADTAPVDAGAPAKKGGKGGKKGGGKKK